MTAPVEPPSYMGHYYCDRCSGEYTAPVWIVAGARLCANHYRRVTGQEPPPALALEDLPEPPPAEPAWTKLLPGLRMRPAPATPGVELQGVRQVQLEDGPATVGDHDPWTLADRDLVELVLMASAHRNDSEPDKLMVRSALLRILHGTTPP